MSTFGDDNVAVLAEWDRQRAVVEDLARQMVALYAKQRGRGTSSDALLAISYTAAVESELSREEWASLAVVLAGMLGERDVSP